MIDLDADHERPWLIMIELARTLFPHLARLRIEDVHAVGAVTPARPTTCPCCGALSSRVHSRYQRRLLDTAIAGISSGVDLALALVRDDLGVECAAAVAEAMVVFMPRPGNFSQFSAPSRQHIGPAHPLRRVVDAVAADPAATYSVPAMASIAAVSTRQLTRLFHDEIGTTPARYVELVRLENAQAMLQAGHTVEGAAHRSGFGSADTLRRVFATRLGLTPTAYRDQAGDRH